MNGAPRVAMVTGSVSRLAGGLFTSVRRLAQALHVEGADVSVFAPSDEYSHEDLAAWEPIHVHVFPRRGPVALAYGQGLRRSLLDGNHQVTHLHGLWQYPSVAVSAWKRQTGRPVMISPRGTLDNWALSNSAMKKRLALALFERRNLSGAACLHALTMAEMRAFRSLGLTAPIAVIPNGVDMPAHDASSVRPSCLNGDTRRVLLFLGRIHPKKGIAETLLAWSRVLQEEKIKREWVLVIAGWDDGGHVEGLRQLSSDLGIDTSVRFTGPIFGDEKTALLRAAEAFILASYSEGLPMAVLEAWSYSCPVLMTTECNLPEGFSKGAAIEISTDPAAMALVLRASLTNPNLPRLGTAGNALVAERFSWDRVGHDLAKVYSWLAGHGPKPDCVVME